MLTRELGADYVNDAFSDRWFRRSTTGEVCILHSIGSSTATISRLEMDNDETEWGDPFNVSSEEFVDLTSFQYPELGYRHGPGGNDLWFISRAASTRRGIYEGNVSATNITTNEPWSEYVGAYKAKLIFQPDFKSLTEAIRLLNASPRGCRGWAISGNFAILRSALGDLNYNIHFAGKLVGTCTSEGAVEIASRSINRMFQKVA